VLGQTGGSAGPGGLGGPCGCSGQAAAGLSRTGRRARRIGRVLGQAGPGLSGTGPARRTGRARVGPVALGQTGRGSPDRASSRQTWPNRGQASPAEHRTGDPGQAGARRMDSTGVALRAGLGWREGLADSAVSARSRARAGPDCQPAGSGADSVDPRVPRQLRWRIPPSRVRLCGPGSAPPVPSAARSRVGAARADSAPSPGEPPERHLAQCTVAGNIFTTPSRRGSAPPSNVPSGRRISPCNPEFSA
jgi:hypothetical protein